MLITQPFHLTDQFAFLEPVEAGFSDLQEEARLVIKGFKAVTWIRRSTFQRHQGFCVGQRGRFFLSYAGLDSGVNQRLCPRAADLVKQVPGQVSAAFYLLDASSYIKPHQGEFGNTLRVHMGLVVPENCALRVANETHPWVEGKFFVFDDSYEHEAWNRSSETRCVLHLDFSKTGPRSRARSNPETGPGDDCEDGGPLRPGPGGRRATGGPDVAGGTEFD